ncbi:3-oxoacyl-ACP synthase [Flavihumibacter sp. R14]|nr:3-oxoacyl-ACP synthase [Flavihumibacter soli]
MAEQMSENLPRITGLGYAVPAKIRINDDPVFDWLKHNSTDGEKLFQGYEQRRVLDTGEDLISIMLPAAKNALENAKMTSDQVDLLIGTGSVSQYRNPNVLSLLHQELGLQKSVWVIPVDCEFSNYNASLLMADGLIRAGRISNALICIGGNWTRNVSYQTPQAVSAGDGAGAAVLADSSDRQKWTLLDQCTLTDSHYYGSMYSSGNSFGISPPIGNIQKLWTDSFFQITDEGIAGFKDFGVNSPPQVVLQLLQRHSLKGSDIALISHQASTVLMDHWSEVIQPGQYINTIKPFGNMAPANIPVTLAWADESESVSKDFLMLLAIGPDMHTNAMLFERNK